MGEKDYNYLILGGGMTADAAAAGIREIDDEASIGIITQENHLPYARPPLSKGLWTGTQVDEIWLGTDDLDVTFHLGRTATSIDPGKKQVVDDAGNTYSYKKLLIATGGEPKRLECPHEDVCYYRTLDDYYNLRVQYDQGEHFVVIGGGFIGCEMAAALAMNGKKVTMIFPESMIGSRQLPPGFANFISNYYKEKGVELISGQTVTEISRDEQLKVVTDGGDTFMADGVIAGLGITPRTELAEKAGLKVENGIHVSRTLQTDDKSIYAAGDVANFYNPLLEKRIRVEHEDAARTMGRQAGRNMAGAGEEYHHLPSWYSDLFELGYEAIGEVSVKMEMVEDWHDLYRKGVIYYLEGGYVRGALLVGIWEHLDQVRELISSKERMTREALVGRITA